MAIHGGCCSRGENDHFRTYEDVARYLDGLGLFHMDMGLDRVVSALETLECRRLPCPVVQVVGTNGKGSTGAFLQSLAMAHGFRAGLFTSPHFLSPVERIRLNNRYLPASAWPGLASQVYAVRPDLTYFEMLTVMAALAFRDTEPDLLIFEAGLGGRHDATTALDADMVCFTPVALDHTEVLGKDLPAIARDKADAMRDGIWAAVTAPQLPEALLALKRRALALKIPLIGVPGDDSNATVTGQTAKVGTRGKSRPWSPDSKLLDELMQGVLLGLSGPHQQTNARTALTAWLMLCHKQGWHHSDNAVRLGLERAFIPGRMQKITAMEGQSPVILDGAHNPHGMTALVEAMRGYRHGLSGVIFSCLADKEPETMVTLVKELADGAPIYVPTIKDNPRALPGQDLAAMFEGEAQAVPDLKSALATAFKKGANDAPVLVCGSLYLLAEFFELSPRSLELPADR